MPAFIGTDNSIALQKRLRDRQPEVARSPHLVNGGWDIAPRSCQ